MSRRRSGLKSFLEKSFFDFSSIEFVIVNDILAFVTLLSIAGLVLETVESLAVYHWMFKAIEYGAVGIFGLEYLGRLFVAEKRFRYVFSFFGLIDLLAILPSLLGLGNLTSLKSVRMLRILRFLRVIRLAKIARAEADAAKRHQKDFEELSVTFNLNLAIYFFAVFSAVIIWGGLLYLVEGGTNAQFENIPKAMLWVINVFIGGIPVSGSPMTVPGITIAVCTKFTAMVLLGFLINMIAGLVNKTLLGAKSKGK